MTENRIIELEIKIAYQDDLLNVLSDMIAKQQKQIDCLERIHNALNERVNNLSLKIPDDTSAHEIPPHY